MQTIRSRKNPIVRGFRALADEPDATGARLLLDGAHLVREALAAGLSFERVAVSMARLASPGPERALIDDLDRIGVEVLSVTEGVLAAMSPVRTPTGVVAIVGRRPTSPTEVCRRSTGVVLAVFDVQDPGNLGSLLRSGEAGGAGGVLVCGRSANPFSPKAVRGSMGSILRMAVATAPSADAAIACMKDFDYRLVAAVPRGGRDPDAIDWLGRVGLLLGGEGRGLDAGAVSNSADQVTIPMAPPVESLNVAVAGALLMYAARRQRTRV